MSKKIMKRSLALGALMAFVITGSAMAAEVKLDSNNFVHDLDVDKEIEESVNVSTSPDLSSAGSGNYGIVRIKDGVEVSLKGDVNLEAQHLAPGYIYGVRVENGTYNQKGDITFNVKGIEESKDGIRPLMLVGGEATLNGDINVNLTEMAVSRLQCVIAANGAQLTHNGNINLIAKNVINHEWWLNNTVGYYLQSAGTKAVLTGDINMTFINDKSGYGVYKNIYGIGISQSELEHNGNINLSFGGNVSELFPTSNVYDSDADDVTIYGHVVVKDGTYKEGENNVKILSFGATDENGKKVPFVSSATDPLKCGFANFDTVVISENSSLYIDSQSQVNQFTADKLLANTDGGQSIEGVINNTEINSKGGALSLAANTLILENNATATMSKLNAEDGAKIAIGEGANLVVNGDLIGNVTLALSNLEEGQVIVTGEATGDNYVAEVSTSALQEGVNIGQVARDQNGSILDEVVGVSDSVYESGSADIDENGNIVNVIKNVDSANVSVNDMVAIGMMSWRAEMNDMNKRMGELRNANGEHGVWVRMVRGESEFNSVKNQYNQYQLGYDEKLSVDKRWTVGAALSYTDAENSFAEGTGESTNKAFSVYGSKLNEDGTFVDLIAKYARLENDFKTYSGMGDADYDTNAYSFSAEVGKRIQQGKGLWIEPQVELTYGKVSAVDYVTDKGVNVAQDCMESLVGRIGFSLGKDIEKGNVYARASYLYDFDGETKAVLDGDAVLTNDLGGGWWEVGVGANINLSKATYIYADVEKTFGGEVDTNWQWNLGVRYSF